jgi:hypothetical protein
VTKITTTVYEVNSLIQVSDIVKMTDNFINDNSTLHKFLKTDPNYVNEINFFEGKFGSFQDCPRQGINFKLVLFKFLITIQFRSPFVLDLF